MNEQELLLKAASAYDAGDFKAGADFIKAATELRSAAANQLQVAQPPAIEPQIPIAPKGPTIGDIQNGDNPQLTLEEALSLYDQNQTAQQQNVQQPDVVNIPGLGSITRVPEAGGSVFQRFGRQDPLGTVLGRNGNQEIGRLLSSYENLLTSFDTQRSESEDLLNKTRSGEFDSRFSNPAFQNVRVAKNLEEAQQIRESGYIPIAARDAELIRRTGQQEAERLIADAQAALNVRQNEGRVAATQQASLGLGNAISSALTRSSVGSDQNRQLANLTQQARESILQGVENKRQAGAEAGRIDAKSKIDAMLANTEAVQQLQNLMIQDASDSFRLRFEEERRLQNRVQEIQDRKLLLESQRPEILSNLVQLSLANNPQTESQFIQDRTTASTDRLSLGVQQKSQQSVLTAAQLAQDAQRVAQRAVNSKGFFTGLDEQAADSEIRKLIQTYNEFNNLTDPNSRINSGLISPEVIAIRERILKEVQPMIAQLQSSGIVAADEFGNPIPLSDVESNDSGPDIFSKSFPTIGQESILGIDELVNAFGGPNAPPASLRPGINNSSSSVTMSVTQKADNLVDKLK